MWWKFVSRRAKAIVWWGEIEKEEKEASTMMLTIIIKDCSRCEREKTRKLLKYLNQFTFFHFILFSCSPSTHTQTRWCLELCIELHGGWNTIWISSEIFRKLSQPPKIKPKNIYIANVGRERTFKMLIFPLYANWIYFRVPLMIHQRSLSLRHRLVSLNFYSLHELSYIYL